MMDDIESNEWPDPGSPASDSLAEREQLSEGRPDEEPAEAPVAAGAVESGQVGEESPPADGKPPSKPKVVPHFTPGERAARGKAARAEIPRSTQGDIAFPKRRDPVALLEEQAVSRVPELVPIRYGRMLVSPFTFYRGAALIMAADLASTRHRGSASSSAGTRICRTSACSARPTPSGLRHQRLRRDGPRAVGVGREAPGGELRDRRPRARLLRREERRTVVLGSVARLPDAMAASRPCATSRSGTPTWRRRAIGSSRGQVDPKREASAREGHREDAHPATACRLSRS